MWIKGTINPAVNPGSSEIVLRLTALILLLRPMGPWGVRPFLLGLAGLAVVMPRVLRSPATWYALSILIGLRIVADWPVPDNHIYLLGYWCLALALALGDREIAKVLKRSSSFLIGLAFLMAVLWKGLLSPDYRDGRFFSVTLLKDGRFEETTLLFGGLTRLQLKEARDYLQPLPAGAEWVEEPLLAKPKSFKVLTTVSTWGLLFCEALIAGAFLIPLARRLVPMRHLLLLSFCIVTYAFAPVAGFGWLLLTMGLASCGSEHRWLRAAYITVWGLVLFYEDVPWAELLVEKLGRG